MLSPQVSLGPSTLCPTPIYRLWPVKSHPAPLNIHLLSCSPCPQHILPTLIKPVPSSVLSTPCQSLFSQFLPKQVAQNSRPKVHQAQHFSRCSPSPPNPPGGWVHPSAPDSPGPSFPAHLLSSGRRSSQPPSSIPAPSGRIRGYDVASLKRGVPATSSLRTPEAPGNGGGTLGGWAQGDALHPG